MKTIVFVMILAWPGGSFPPHEEVMESLEACQAKAAETTKGYMDIDDTFRFVAGCRINSTKSDPA